MENNKIQAFNNEEFGEVRTVMVSGEPWFVAVDVCKALELSNPTVAVSRLDEDERSKFNLGRQGEGTIVNEAGLYSLILGSRKPEAKAFKRWITHDVIPAIRKTGGYIQGEETMSDDDLIARALVMAQKKIELREKELREKDELLELQKPKVEFADHVTDSENAIDMGTFAKYIQKAGIDMGRNTLFRWLRGQGILMENNVPYQRYLDLGWFRVVEMVYSTPNNKYTTSKTLVTGKGQVSLVRYIRKYYVKEAV